jgi:hypothetical protein
MDETEKTLSAYTKISDQIAREDNIVNQRITWGLSFNAALVGLATIGYSATKDSIKDHKDFAIVGIIFIAIAIIAIWVCYLTIRGIIVTRKQQYYVREIYDTYWKVKCEDELRLPRPYGSRLHGKYLDGTEIKLRPGSGEKLFNVIIVGWFLAISAAALAVSRIFF